MKTKTVTGSKQREFLALKDMEEAVRCLAVIRGRLGEDSIEYAFAKENLWKALRRLDDIKGDKP